MVKKAQKIIVGLSGGVDSSVAAALLCAQGYEVEALFMKNWEEDDEAGFCAAEADAKDAEAVCDVLGIPLQAVNFSEAYWDKVFAHFLTEYEQGRTPNPDILCNQEIKFKAFLDHAKALGADYIATGHYVRKGLKQGHEALLTGLDTNKDQSYFLYTLGQAQLQSSLFPIGELTKPEVRKIAQEKGFITHNKKDSTGICFIGERRFKTFLQDYLPAKPGAIVTESGRVIGQHDGLMYYTLGQRQGLGIGGVANAPEAPWFVVKKHLETNELVVVQGIDHPLLYSDGLLAKEASWTHQDFKPTVGQRIQAKVRYRQKAMPCVVTGCDETGLSLQFDEPVRAVTPGQAVVCYDDEQCLGGATIIGGMGDD